MAEFILQHRKSEEVYSSVEEAKGAISSIDGGKDGEIVVSRYSDESGNTKSVIGVCNEESGNTNFTLFSYDDVNIKKALPNFWKGTLEEYNQITDKDDDCIYFVVGDTYNAD